MHNSTFALPALSLAWPVPEPVSLSLILRAQDAYETFRGGSARLLSVPHLPASPVYIVFQGNCGKVLKL